MGKISTAEVPSATLGTGSSTPRHKRCVTDKSVRRSAQDDDFVGVSTKNILNKLALMGLRPVVFGPRTPDFLSRLVALANFMRLSLMKAADAVVFGAA
jgi:hypothetical protein